MLDSRACLFAAVAVMASTLSARAQEGAAFFKEKTVTYIVASAPGGGYDAYARLVADYMQKHLPGSTFIVKNVPGAGHMVGANTIYASKPDGLTIGSFNTGLIYNQIIKQSGVRFDLVKMTWIGKASTDPRVLVMAQQTPISTFAEFLAHKSTLNFATSGIGGANYVEVTMMTSAMKWPVKLLHGYNGLEDQMAMRRGEIAGGLGSRSTFEPFVKNGFGRMIVQIGGRDKDVPQLRQFVTDAKVLPLVALIESQGEIGRLTAGPPDIPADRLGALQDSYRKAMADPELVEKANKSERPVEPAIGDDVHRMVKAALAQSPETIALLTAAMKAPAK